MTERDHKILGVLRGTWLTAAEVARATGLTLAEAREALYGLDGLVVHVDGEFEGLRVRAVVGEDAVRRWRAIG